MDTKRILIVDDDPNFRKTLIDILKSKEYTPIATDTGQAALNRVGEEPPAVALIDLKLEDMSGMELMKKIKERCPGTECIALIGYASPASAIEAANLGAYAYIQKPYDIEQLLVTIRRAVEKRETEEALKRYAERLKTLRQIDQAILAARSPVAIAEAALARIWQLIPYQQASVVMFDFEVNQATVLAAKGNNRQGMEAGACLPLEMFGRRGESRQPEAILIEDITAFAQRAPVLQALLAQGMRSGINVPLISKGEQIGVLALGADNPGIFNEEHLEIAGEVAAELAIAIQNARLIETEQIQLERESALLTLARVVGSTLDLNEVLQTILTHLHLFVPYDSATIQLLEGDTLRTVAVTGFESEAEVQNFVYPLAKFSLNRQLIEGQRPIRIDDVKVDDRFIVVPGAERVRAFVGVPLLAQDRPFGVITLDGYQPAQFTETDVKLAVAVAVHAAIAINNARMFEQVQAGRQQLRTLSRRLLEVQEAERRFLARELHDEIGQALTMVKINLQVIQRSLEAQAPSPHLERGISIVDQAIQQVRNLSLDLRPSLLDDLGLVPALRWYVDRQAQEAGFSAQFTAASLEKRPPPDLEIACFRLVQEALTNVVRHAKAQQVDVELQQYDQELRLTIRDDGVGFDAQHALARAARGMSLGLLGMQERVLFAGGRIEIESTPAQGTEIRVYLPLPSSQSSDERKDS